MPTSFEDLERLYKGDHVECYYCHKPVELWATPTNSTYLSAHDQKGKPCELGDHRACRGSLRRQELRQEGRAHKTAEQAPGVVRSHQ